MRYSRLTSRQAPNHQTAEADDRQTPTIDLVGVQLSEVEHSPLNRQTAIQPDTFAKRIAQALLAVLATKVKPQKHSAILTAIIDCETRPGRYTGTHALSHLFAA
jgi:hypothetical protein